MRVDGPKVTIICVQCGNLFERLVAVIKYRKRVHGDRPQFCSMTCFGLAQRTDTRTPEEKKADKAAYDAAYRERNRAKKKAWAAAYHKRTADREKERAYRQANMHRHVEYCRRPEYRAAKQVYDRHYRAQKAYGEYAEAFLLTIDIDREVSSRMTKEELAAAKGTVNKKQNRRKEYERLNSFKFEIGSLGNP